MKLSVGIFFGGFFAALGALLFLVAFGTDYWLLATEIGTCSKAPEDAGVSMIMRIIYVGFLDVFIL